MVGLADVGVVLGFLVGTIVVCLVVAEVAWWRWQPVDEPSRVPAESGVFCHECGGAVFVEPLAGGRRLISCVECGWIRCEEAPAARIETPKMKHAREQGRGANGAELNERLDRIEQHLDKLVKLLERPRQSVLPLAAGEGNGRCTTEENEYIKRRLADNGQITTAGAK